MDTPKKKLMVFNFVFLALIVLGSPVIMMSPMILDAPGSENSIVLTSIVYSLWLLVPVYFISSIGSFILYKFKKDKIAVIWSLLPLINISIFLVAIIFLFTICHNLGKCP